MKSKFTWKNWITTLVLGAVIFNSSNELFSLKDLLVTFLFSALFSLPTFILYFLLYDYLIKSNASTFFVKLILNILAIVCITITLNVIDGELLKDLSLIYGLSIIISSFLYKIEK